MIDEKLDELGKYVEEITKKESFNLIKSYIVQVSEEFENSDSVQSDIELDLKKEIIKIISNYEEKGLSNNIISYHLYNILYDIIKKAMIEKKASDLEIDKRFYKNEMRLLFKGKWE